MGKYLIGLVLCLGVMTSSFAQEDSLAVQNDSLQVQENDMVCFLTDENTITCFVAPEEFPQQEGQTAPNEDNLYQNEEPEENDAQYDDDDFMNKEIKEEHSSEDKKERKGLFKRKDKDQKEEKKSYPEGIKMI